MGNVGAELSTMRDLHGQFRTNAQSAADIKKAIDGGLASTVWTGTYSNKFQSAWTDYRRNLDSLQQALSGAADDVKTNHNNIAEATGESDRL